LLCVLGKAEGGVEGLGGDMHGVPTGMGAGAEPLGAFENEDTPNMDGGQQTLDDKSKSCTDTILMSGLLVVTFFLHKQNPKTFTQFF